MIDRPRRHYEALWRRMAGRYRREQRLRNQRLLEELGIPVLEKRPRGGREDRRR